MEGIEKPTERERESNGNVRTELEDLKGVRSSGRTEVQMDKQNEEERKRTRTTNKNRENEISCTSYLCLWNVPPRLFRNGIQCLSPTKDKIGSELKTKVHDE